MKVNILYNSHILKHAKEDTYLCKRGHILSKNWLLLGYTVLELFRIIIWDKQSVELNENNSLEAFHTFIIIFNAIIYVKIYSETLELWIYYVYSGIPIKRTPLGPQKWVHIIEVSAL